MYPDKVPYLKIQGVFHRIIYETLITGLKYLQKSRLEEYLIRIFEPYDTLGNGIIHINDIITALRVSDKIMLSKVQVIQK